MFFLFASVQSKLYDVCLMLTLNISLVLCKVAMSYLQTYIYLKQYFLLELCFGFLFMNDVKYPFVCYIIFRT